MYIILTVTTHLTGPIITVGFTFLRDKWPDVASALV